MTNEQARANEAAFFGAPTPGVILDAKVLSVEDGDTMTVVVTEVVRLRLKDCWAYESKNDHRIDDEAEKAKYKALGMEAKEYLRKLAIGKACRVVVERHGRFGQSMTFDRVVSTVYLEGLGSETLNEHLVKQGYAKKEKPGFLE